MNYRYITSPIFYPNDNPHLGTAYTLIICDFLNRAYKIFGYQTFFTTGTDEHGKKIETAAKIRGLTPENHILDKRNNFLQLKEILNLSFDKFIGTHDEEHVKAVEFIWNKVNENGYIYKSKYSGWYSERDETYFKEKELIDGKAPTGANVEYIEEECYFFKLKEFQDKLIDLYTKHPEIIQPQWRVKELLGSLKNGLEDLCISRHKSKLTWGINVPNDPDHVIYVWFDALTNYITCLKYGTENFKKENNQLLWREVMHIIGKDIIYFHGIIWPAILMAAELPLFKNLIVHGWLTIEGEKMSKSLGNIVDPKLLCEKYPSDYIKYFLLREIPLSSDYDFKESLLQIRINDELADKIGNLINRALSMVEKYCHGIIPKGILDEDIIKSTNYYQLDEIMLNYVETRCISDYIVKIMELATIINQYIEKKSPWNKSLTLEERDNILYNTMIFIYKISKYLYCVTPNIGEKILESLCLDTVEKLNSMEISGNKIKLSKILVPKIL